MTDRYALKGSPAEGAAVHVYPNPGATSPYVGVIEQITERWVKIRWLTNRSDYDIVAKTSLLWNIIGTGRT